MEKSLRLLPLFILLSFFASAQQQSVPFPTTNRNFEDISPWGYNLQDGAAGFDTSPFLPFIYRDMWYRVMPPNGVTYNYTTKKWVAPSDTTKYPLILFFQGRGEMGSDNNKQLKNGGLKAMQAVQSGAFPGFLLYPQEVDPTKAKALIEKIIANYPIDINRIYVHGLSVGATWTWIFATTNPTLVAGIAPASGVINEAMDEKMLYTGIRLAQGGLDGNPGPNWTQTIVDWYNNNGGHLEYFLYPDLAHGTWDRMYSRPDFYPWFLQQKKNRIYVRYDKNLLCPNDPISVVLGFTPGFDAYEWQFNGQTIAGQTAYKMTATQYGTYKGRIKNRGKWSQWSDAVTVGIKPPTITPAITANTLRTIYLPAPDGSTTTELVLPEGYQSYEWKNSSGQVVSTSRVYSSATVGTYTAGAIEVNGCTTVPSPVFEVKNAVGPKAPDAIADFRAYAVSSTSILLSWSDKPVSTYNETGFEIYRATAEAGPYKLVAVAATDEVKYTDTGLTANTTYYYKIRPINSFSTAPVSNTISVVTTVDATAPTAPANFKITGTTAASVAFSWTASTDNVGVYKYDVYRDNVMVLSVTPPTGSTVTAEVFNLVAGQQYQFYVKARDVTGNVSLSSSNVIGIPTPGGWNYEYYEAATTFGPNIPNFATLTPTATGNSATTDASTLTHRAEHFAYKFTATLLVPSAGTYTFYTNSDDGSKLYIGAYSHTATAVVNNDGGHGTTEKSGNYTFPAAGPYQLVVTYYQGTGGYALSNINWSQSGVFSKTPIATKYLVPKPVPTGSAPVAPSNLTATSAAYNQINLAWVDNSNNETGFRVYRSTSSSVTATYIPVAVVGTNVTSYQDVGLNANTNYYYKVSAYNAYGESDFNTGIPRGLKYTYYEGPSMSNVNQMITNPVYKTGTAIFDANLRERNESFGLRWVGKINVTAAGAYRFYTTTDDGSAVYIDGALVLNNDTDGPAHRATGGNVNLTVGWHDYELRWRKKTSTNSTIVAGWQKPTAYSDTGFDNNAINSLFYGPEVTAKTAVNPTTPTAPNGASIINIQPFSMTLKWTDRATNEVKYVIQRSYKTNTNYITYKELPANSNTFTDTGLFANARYYYKIIAYNVAGVASSSADLNQVTSNNLPVLTTIQDASLKYGKTLDVSVYGEDADSDPLTLSFNGTVPSFVTLTDSGLGSGTLHFAPTQAQLGTYTISVKLSDNHSGSSIKSFTFTVTDKDVPVLTPISDVSLSEGQTSAFVVNVQSDFTGTDLHWDFAGLPPFATLNPAGSMVTVTLAPGYAASGPYHVTTTVTDPLGASASKEFNINVTDVNPNQKFLVNISGGTNAPAPWNNVTGLTASSFKDDSGVTTAVGLQFLNEAYHTFNEGAQTGNNSGVFPDVVLKEYYYFGVFGYDNVVNVKVTGLDPSRKYNFDFMGSSKWPGAPGGDNGSTIYTINGVSVSLRVQDNVNSVGHLPSVTPAADGSVTFSMSKGNETPVGYLNGFTMEALYQDGTLPAAPRAVTTAFVNNAVNVTWVDAPFNEEGFDIYRSSSAAGPFDKINVDPIAKNSTSYVDRNLVAGDTYYYQLKAFNNYGESVFSNVASLLIPQISPDIQLSGSTTVEPNAYAMLNLTTLSSATLSLTNLPAFAYESPWSNSSTDIILMPGISDVGSYTFTATATDAGGAIVTKDITITVSEYLTYRIAVNFSQSSNAPAPWNNTAKVPAANDVFANLKDANNNGTGVSLTLQTAFGGAFNEGAQTGNNSGVVPDAVLKEYYYFGIWGAAETINMKVSGLTTQNKYRFKFLASSNWTNYGAIADNGATVFTIGNKSTSVNVQNNTQSFGVIENVLPNAAGELIIKLSKGGTAAAGYINAMVIEAMPVNPAEFVPTNLVASAMSPTQIALTWNDNSPVDTGYEIYRSATGDEGSYNLLTTTAADATSYTDTPPSAANKIFYYKVLAKQAQGNTPFSNVAKASVVSFKVSVNISSAATYDAPAPWNNISKYGFDGDVFVGFKNQSGNNTGIRLRVVKALEGSNNWGPTASPANSGIVPDKVLQSFWFNDAYFPVGVFTIEGLDQSFDYNIGFLGSIAKAMIGTTVVKTNFTIGDRTVTNSNNDNFTEISYIRNVSPTANSEIQFTIQEAPGSPWSIWNALIIEGYPNGKPATGRIADTQADGNVIEVRYGEATNQLTFYPNPVEDYLNIDLKDTSFGNAKYQFFDLQGRPMQAGEIYVDAINFTFSIDATALTPAMYLMKVTYPDGRIETQKFIKK